MTFPSLLLGDFHLVVGRRIRRINRSPLKAFWRTILTHGRTMFVPSEASPITNLFQFIMAKRVGFQANNCIDCTSHFSRQDPPPSRGSSVVLKRHSHFALRTSHRPTICRYTSPSMFSVKNWWKRILDLAPIEARRRSFPLYLLSSLNIRDIQ